MRNTRTIKAVTLLLTLLLFCPFSYASKTPVDTLIVSEMWEIDGLDPAKEGTFAKEKAMLVETLVDANPDFSLKPQLAESWKQVSDTLWQFTLRPNVSFHNGVPLTAELAAGALTHAMEINPSVRKITKIKQIVAKSSHLLEIETSEPYPALPAALVYSDTAIIHPDSPKNEKGIVIHPIGTGPYMLTEWKQAEQTVILDKFNNYWDSLPKIKQIIYRSIPDPSTRSLEIQKGSVDLVADAPYGDLDFLKKKGLDVTIANTARVYLLNFGNLANTPYQDKRVRQALSEGINRDEIVKYVLFGMGKAAAGPYEVSMVFANSDLKPLGYNPEKARKLLAEAGWTDSDNDGILDKNGEKFSLTLFTYPQRPGLKPMAMAIQQQWQQLGIVAEVRVMDWSAINEVMKPHDIKLSASATAMVPDPDYFMRRFYTTDGESNTWGYSSKEVDKLLGLGIKTADTQQRLDLYKKAQAIIYDDMPLIPVSYYGVNIITQANVKGFVFNPVAHDYMLNTQIYKEQ